MHYVVSLLIFTHEVPHYSSSRTAGRANVLYQKLMFLQQRLNLLLQFKVCSLYSSLFESGLHLSRLHELDECCNFLPLLNAFRERELVNSLVTAFPQTLGVL